MTELRTVAIIGIAVGGTLFACLVTLAFFLLVRFRYNKWKNENPSKDPGSHSKLFACYACCCCVETKNTKQSKAKALNPQVSVSYKSDTVSMGEMQEIVIKNAEGYKDSAFTNDAFVKSNDTDNSSETRTAGIAKDMKIIITNSDDEDGECEVRRDSPIRRSVDAYSEIDLGRESGIDSPRLQRSRISKTEDNAASKKGKFKMKFRSTKK